MIMEKHEKRILFKEDFTPELCELSKKLFETDLKIKQLEQLKQDLKAKIMSLSPDEDYTFIDKDNKFQICCYKQNKVTKTLNRDVFEKLPVEFKNTLYIEKQTLIKMIMSKPLSVKESDLGDENIDKESI